MSVLAEDIKAGKSFYLLYRNVYREVKIGAGVNPNHMLVRFENETIRIWPEDLVKIYPITWKGLIKKIGKPVFRIGSGRFSRLESQMYLLGK